MKVLLRWIGYTCLIAPIFTVFLVVLLQPNWGNVLDVIVPLLFLVGSIGGLFLGTYILDKVEEVDDEDDVRS